MVNKSIDIVLSLDGAVLAGQQNAVLSQTMQPIEITNQIKGDWRESISGLRTWRVNCTGLYVVTEKRLHQLEDAFLNDKNLTASLTLDGAKYEGSVLLISFPIETQFNKGAIYRAELLGTGPLIKIDTDVSD